jgi:hypothetical protein
MYHQHHKKRPLTPEELELDAYFEAFHLSFPNALAYHVPNEGKRARHIAKRIGILSGVPDIFVDEARGGFFGLRIEMKRTDKKSRIQDSQKHILCLMQNRGYCAVFAWGWEQAMQFTKNYMANAPTLSQE